MDTGGSGRATGVWDGESLANVKIASGVAGVDGVKEADGTGEEWGDIEVVSSGILSCIDPEYPGRSMICQMPCIWYPLNHP